MRITKMRMRHGKLGLRILAAAALFALATSSHVRAAVIFSNPITDANPSTANPFTAGQTVAANMTVTGIGRGTGINANAASNRYNANNWNSSSLDANDFFTFTLDANPGFEIDFTNFVYTGQASGTGPTQFAFRSSLDSFAANIGSPTAAGTTISLGAAAYQNLSAPITFRLYGWGGSSAAGTYSINDFTFNGEVASTASPDIDPALTAVNFVDRIVGTAATQAVTLNEVGGALANYTSSFTGDATVTAGSAGAIAALGSGSITVGITTAFAGSKSGTVTIDDGNADVDQIAVTGDVFDPSTARFLSNGGTTLSYDFGTFLQGSGVQSLNESIENALQTLGFTAGLDFDTIAGSGDTAILSTDLVDGEFSNRAAGAANAYPFVASFNTNTAPGVYSASYTLALSDADAYVGAGAAGSQQLTLELTGTVIPEPGSMVLLLLGSVALIGVRRFGR